MSAHKNDISQIDKYLNGKLDARAMHQLEQDAQDDPFLMEALDGFEANGRDQQANMVDLEERLASRIAPKKERNILLWRVLPIAAALLLMFGIGYWFFTSKSVQKQYVNVIKPKPVEKSAVPKMADRQQIIAPVAAVTKRVHKKHVESLEKAPSIAPVQQPESILAAANTDVKQKVVYKTDTVEYKASDYKVRANATMEDVLKKVPGLVVDSNGNITPEGRAVTKARLNGKDFLGGNVQSATKNLPADIVNKIQIVDDYGDQASKTGVKGGDPTKVLNITTISRVNNLKGYKAYIKKQAAMPDGSRGKVKVAFKIGIDGIISNIRVISGDNNALKEKAVDIIKNGPVWVKQEKPKEVKLKITFRK